MIVKRLRGCLIFAAPSAFPSKKSGFWGEWEFYWDKLLSPTNFERVTVESLATYEEVPREWTEAGDHLPSKGVATYRLRVLLPSHYDGVLGVALPAQGSQYRIWVNGTLLRGSGVVGATASQSEPGVRNQLEFIAVDSDELEFIVQIANFHHRLAGMRNAIEIGSPSLLSGEMRSSWLIDSMLGGILLIISFYHISLFLFRPESKSDLFFGLLALCVALREWLTDNTVLMWLVPAVSWESALRIEYFTFYCALPLYFSFMRSLYPQDYPRSLIWVFWGISGMVSVFTLVVDTYTASWIIPSFRVFYIVGVLIAAILLVRVVANRRDYWEHVVFGSVVVGVCSLIEALYLMDVVNAGKITSLGFVAFIFGQGLVLSARLSNSFVYAESLTRRLAEKNDQLVESEAKYRKIFEESKDVLFLCAADGRVTAVNPAIKALVGYTPEELVKMDAVGTVGMGDLLPEIAKLISRKGVVRDYGAELAHRDGSIVPVSVDVTPRRDESGELVGYQGVVRSAVELKMAEEQRMRADRLAVVAAQDPLTGVYNRGYFNDLIKREVSRVGRSGGSLSVVLLDVDHFKQVNDKYGHLVGDAVLVGLANLILPVIRQSDVLARFGGEEFVVLLGDANRHQAQAQADKLRRLVERHVFHVGSVTDLQVTISLGVAQWQQGESPEGVIDRADQALYAAKRNGRNRTSMASPVLKLWNDDNGGNRA